jgi:hypothetical protein
MMKQTTFLLLLFLLNAVHGLTAGKTANTALVRSRRSFFNSASAAAVAAATTAASTSSPAFALQALAEQNGKELPSIENVYLGDVVKKDTNAPKSKLERAREERKIAAKEAAEACKGTNKCVVRGETRQRRNGDW